ncbi:unnamed protein product [Owenia fusiformis]|uniref:Uncharacterized protein n=1 Tax=Owenia fusiformis TaxID=6347 RepID=A0A8S4N1Q1_OWEFU|nr:unnamed protein product [Owenia fusiformis]
MNPMNVNASMSPYTETGHQIKEPTTDGPQLFPPTENDPQVSQHTRADSKTISKQGISVSPKIKPSVSDTNTFNESDNEPLANLLYHDIESPLDDSYNDSDYAHQGMTHQIHHQIHLS